MSEFKQCPICGKYDWAKSHRCPPAWDVVLVDYYGMDDPATVHEYGDAEDAARTFAEQHYAEWDYPDEMEIWVKKPGSTEWEKFNVTVEAVPEFSATPIQPVRQLAF